jgi:hypothetical protein
MASADELRLAEYRHISDAIMDIDRRLLQVFAGTVTAAGALVALAATRRGGSPAATVILDVAPGFLVGAALNFQLGLRREIAKLGMYRKVFFEDGAVGGATWERALGAFRKIDRSPEANDPVSLVYWVFVGLSAALVLVRGSCWGLAPAAAAAYLLWRVEQRWKRVYEPETGECARFERVWREAKGELQGNVAA